MSPSIVPSRITIDFRNDLLPSRTWILGMDEPGGRAELIAFDAPLHSLDAPPLPHVSAVLLPCTCPEYCDRDHANE
jgi:hypothetical protein